MCASIYFPQQIILVNRTGRDPESIHLTFFPTLKLMLSCFVHFSCVSDIRICQVAKSLPQENRLQIPVNLSLAPSPAAKGSFYFVCNWAGRANLQFQHAAEMFAQVRCPDQELIMQFAIMLNSAPMLMSQVCVEGAAAYKRGILARTGDRSWRWELNRRGSCACLWLGLSILLLNLPLSLVWHLHWFPKSCDDEKY